MLSLVLMLFVSVVSILCVLILATHGYWRRRNIVQSTTTFFGGSIGEALTLRKNLADVYVDIYKKYQKYPFVGIYKIFTPSLLIRDPELIKEVLLTEFSNFGDNSADFHESDPFIGRNPFILNGHKWKAFRSQLTHLFTSAKMKSAVTIFNVGAKKMVDFIDRLGEMCEIDVKDVAGRYSVENVVSYTLGLEAKSFERDNSEFRKISYELFQSSTLQALKFYIAMVFPVLTKYLNIRFTSFSTEKLFTSIVSDSIKYRIESSISRSDVLSFLLSMKNAGTFTDHDVTVAIGGFYIDGIETSSVVLSYLLYELAAHPSAQEELTKEIDKVLTNYGGHVDYEAIREMKYLDAAFNETLRLHSVVPLIDRQTTRETTLRGTTKDGEEMKVSLEVGTPIIISIKGLHEDERYFPEPHAFKPERFLPENKASIHKFSFLPFGEGPRICLGKSFGISQVKVAAVHILKNYKLTLGEKMPYPVGINQYSLILYPEQPIRLRFQRRS